MSARAKIALPVILAVVALASLTLWTLLRSEGQPAASAQEVVESACDDLDKAASYDFIGTYKHTPPGGIGTFDMEIKGEVSGEDYHFEYTYEGTLIRALRRVGDKSYATQPGGVWELYNGRLQDFNVTLGAGALGDTPICPDITGVVFKGDVKGLKNVQAHNYWVDVSGQLVQHQLDYFTMAQYDDIQISNGTIVKRFLDVGEPNVIEAPIIP